LAPFSEPSGPAGRPRWVLFLRGKSRRTDKGETGVDQRDPGEGAEGKVPSHKQRAKDTDPRKMQAQQQPQEKRSAGSLQLRDSHAVKSPRAG